MMPTNRIRCSALLFALMLASCTNSGRIPTAEDVPEIMAEAAGTQEVGKWGDSPARRAVRSTFKTMLYFDSVHEAEVRKRFQTPELRSYLMLSDSYVGGNFPRRIAVLLREVQQANQNYLLQVQSFPTLLSEKLASADLPADRRTTLQSEMARVYTTRQQPMVAAVAAFDSFVQLAARLYETAAANSGSVRSMRTGLEISDGRVLGGFNALVDQANRAHEVADSAIRRLDPEQQARFRRMGIATPIKR